MIRVLVFVLASLFVPAWSFCQTTEKGPGVNGWVLPSDGDTIEGMITYDGFYVYHRNSKYEPAKKYFLKDIRAYKIGENIWQYECFDIVQPYFPERTCGFARIIVNGPVSLFSYEGKNMYNEETYTNYYVRRQDNPVVYLVPQNELRFKKEMAGFFYDQSEIKSKILSKEITYEQLLPTVTTYNDWFQGNKKSEP